MHVTLFTKQGARKGSLTEASHAWELAHLHGHVNWAGALRGELPRARLDERCGRGREVTVCGCEAQMLASREQRSLSNGGGRVERWRAGNPKPTHLGRTGYGR